MNLTDVMAQLKLHMFAEVGLFLFLAIFLGVILYTFVRRNQATFDRARRMPLDDGRPAATETRHHE